MRRSGEKGGLPIGAVVIAGLSVLMYALAYCECVRAPRVSLRSWNWPYYAVGDSRIWPNKEVRLPEKSAEWCFYPANWVDRQLHPNKWATLEDRRAIRQAFHSHEL